MSRLITLPADGHLIEDQPVGNHEHAGSAADVARLGLRHLYPQIGTTA